jgi:hypothetical protein
MGLDMEASKGTRITCSVATDVDGVADAGAEFGVLWIK